MCCARVDLKCRLSSYLAGATTQPRTIEHRYTVEAALRFSMHDWSLELYRLPTNAIIPDQTSCISNVRVEPPHHLQLPTSLCKAAVPMTCTHCNLNPSTDDLLEIGKIVKVLIVTRNLRDIVTTTVTSGARHAASSSWHSTSHGTTKFRH